MQMPLASSPLDRPSAIAVTTITPDANLEGVRRNHASSSTESTDAVTRRTGSI